jgi:hypothetical protein
MYFGFQQILVPNPAEFLMKIYAKSRLRDSALKAWPLLRIRCSLISLS